MKKHNMELSYKDLHAIKHSLEKTIITKQDSITRAKMLEPHYHINMDVTKQDLEHETKLLERINEKINYLKDLYKIQ